MYYKICPMQFEFIIKTCYNRNRNFLRGNFMSKKYVKNGILTSEEIRHMELIINSGVDDFYKALELYSFCNYAILLKSYNYYKLASQPLAIRLNHLKNLYNKFDNKGHYDSLKEQYNCDIESIGNKLLQLIEVFTSFKSNEIEYVKVRSVHCPT